MRLVGILAVAVLVLAPAALADPVQVWQESSPGAGDFSSNYLGTIDVWTPTNPTDTIADFYQYGSPFSASYNGELNGGPVPVSSLSQLFLVQASDGLSLVVVHDKPQDGDGGHTEMELSLVGDTAAFLVGDDTTEGLNPGLNVETNSFSTGHTWYTCCTDGYAIGSLDGYWEMYVAFTANPREPIDGVDTWNAVSSNGTSIALDMTGGRRVLLAPVPEPGTLLLLGAGLIGAAVWRRKKR